jgi:hypothetical protein
VRPSRVYKGRRWVGAKTVSVVERVTSHERVGVPLGTTEVMEKGSGEVHLS